MEPSVTRTSFLLVLSLLLAAPSAIAQATRTWVSGVGDDVNPCSRTAPCKTFAGAISKTAAGGEISVLDPGGYGAVTITKSITINGEGTLASILFSGTNGVVVNGAGIIVNLVNLGLNGGSPSSPGINGVRIIQAASVSITNVDIFNYSNAGILDERTTGGSLIVKDTRIHNSIAVGMNVTTIGIRVTPSSGTNGSVLSCDGCTIWGNSLSNSHGVFVSIGSKASITRSNIVSNSTGVGVSSSGASVTLTDTDLSNNGTGLRVSSGGTARLSSTTITGSRTNAIDFAGGSAVSFGNNRINGNSGNNGAGLANVGQQ